MAGRIMFVGVGGPGHPCPVWLPTTALTHFQFFTEECRFSSNVTIPMQTVPITINSPKRLTITSFKRQCTGNCDTPSGGNKQEERLMRIRADT